MKREMDLLRTLLIRLEDLPISGPFVLIDGSPNGIGQPGEDVAKNNYHIQLLREEGFFRDVGKNNLDSRIRFAGLSWKGHDFIDAVRSEDVWSRTRSAADGIGAWTFDLMKELAKGFIKKQVEERTGIKL